MAWADSVPAVRLLGALQVDGPGGPVALGGRKPRALLTLLLVDVGRVVSVDRLVDAVWGDDPPESAESSLQTYVSRLRRSLDGVATIAARGSGYVIDVDARVLDVARAEAGIGEARLLAARGDHRAAAEVLSGAVALWRGRPLDEFADEGWARPEAHRLDELRLAAWEDLADARLATGEHRHLVGQLEPLVDEAPLREGLLARLVVALSRSGRQVDALRVLRNHREYLREELGLAPGPELERLELDLLSQDPDLAAPSSGVPRPWPRSTPVDDTAVLATGEDALAGRAAERAALGDVIERLVAGGGGVAVVSGEPGIGKSALVAWAAADASASGVRVVYVAAPGDEQAPPLWAWMPAVRELLAVVGEGALPPADAASLHELLSPRTGAPEPYAVRLALASLVTGAAALGPLMLVVDDLQALDPASLGAVQFIARETRQAAFVVLATVRSSVEAPGRPLSACIDELARQPVVRWLELDGLGVEAVAAVAARAAGRPVSAAVAEALVERTAGNPFLVRELTHQVALAGRLDDPDAVTDPALIPPTVLDSVGRRIDRLPDDVAEVLRMAAVAGGPVDVDLLARAAGRTVDAVLEALERACAVGLLVAGGPGELRFTHALVAEAALAALGPIGRARRHLALHGALTSRHDRQAVLARARHALGALPVGDPTVALEALMTAAAQAADDGGHEQASAFWVQGLAVLERSPDPPADARWRLTDGLARARLAAGDVRAGLRTVLDACAEAEQLGDRHRLAFSATAPVDLALWPWRGYGEVDHRMVRALERAIATADPADAELRVRAHAGLAVERYYLDDAAAADEAAASAIELARRHGDPALLALALDLGFVARWRSDRMADLEALADELVAVASHGGLDDRTRFVGLFLRTVARLTLGRVEEAIGDEPALFAFADRLRSPTLLVALDGYRAMRATMHGDHAEAERWIDAGLELYRRTQVWEPRDASLLLMAPIAVERGGAAALAGSLLAAADGPDSRLLRRLGCIILAEAGSDEVVRDEIARRGPLPEPARDWSWLANACGLASVAVACHDRDLALRWATELAPYAGQLAMFGSDGCLGAADEYRARCLAICGDAEASDAFDAARALHRRLGAPYLEARTLLHQATWTRQRDARAADQLLDEARRLADGAPALIVRIDDQR